MDVIVFVSPKAGSGAAREQIPQLVELLNAEGIENETLSCPDTLQEKCNQRRETGVPQPVVIAAGGDGTISLVASRTAIDTPLLPMPMGTENLLARFVGQSNDAQAVFQTLKRGRAMKLDAGMANGRLFLIMATVGFDAEVVRRLHQNRKGHIRRVSYAVPIFQSFFRYRFPKLAVLATGANGGEFTRTAGWAMVFNLPCYAAGLKISASALGDDGNLNLVTFAGRSLIRGLAYVIGVFSSSHQRLRDVHEDQVKSVRIESDQSVPYELDGDFAGMLPLEIELLPERVTLLIP